MSMKEFLKIMEKDILKEDFTRKDMFVYGILAPIALFLIMILAGWLDSLCK